MICFVSVESEDVLLQEKGAARKARQWAIIIFLYRSIILHKKVSVTVNNNLVIAYALRERANALLLACLLSR